MPNKIPGLMVPGVHERLNSHVLPCLECVKAKKSICDAEKSKVCNFWSPWMLNNPWFYRAFQAPGFAVLECMIHA